MTFTGREHTKIVISTGKTTHVYTDELVFFTVKADFDTSGEIQSGKYRYPFEFATPEDSPTSYDGRYGWIEYKLKALVEISWKPDAKDEAFLNVRGTRQAPASESQRGFAEKDGYSVLDVELEESTIYLGEEIDLKFRVSNNVNIRGVRIELRSIEHTRASRQKRRSPKTLVKHFVENDQIQRDLWTEFRIQTSDTMPPNFDGEYLDVESELKITLDIPWRNDKEVKIPIVLAHRGAESVTDEELDDWFK